MTSPEVTSEKPRLEPHDLATRAARFALEKKARNVVILDLREFDYLCDYFVVLDGESEPQVKAIAESIENGLKELGETPWHVEGLAGRRWILLDFVDVVIHVFHSETRELYMLERLWGDAPLEAVDD